MKINWKVRFKNKTFWLAIIPAIIVLIKAVAGVFGIEIDLSVLSDRLLDVVNALFIVLSIVGIVVDPTTDGLTDSTQALNYDTPKKG